MAHQMNRDAMRPSSEIIIAARVVHFYCKEHLTLKAAELTTYEIMKRETTRVLLSRG